MAELVNLKLADLNVKGAFAIQERIQNNLDRFYADSAHKVFSHAQLEVLYDMNLFTDAVFKALMAVMDSNRDGRGERNSPESPGHSGVLGM